MCTPLASDVASVEGCERLARALSGREPKLDILVNNAGAAWGAQMDTFPEHGWDKVVDLNLKSPFFLTQKLLGMLRAAATPARPAKVINIASVDGLRLSPWETYSYHASKAGLFHLTRRMAALLVKENINVTSIAPGAFASDMNRAARDRGEQVARTIPAGRIGRPEDIAAAAIFLAAASGDYVVGSSVTVDGGLVDASFGPSIDGDG
jgi:NAD(P)-dependent dehydrogenase (short-subunit alcohol dehydrogenase family)